MPVAVPPRLKRLDPVEAPSAGQIDVRVPDMTRARAQVGQALEGLGQAAVDYEYTMETRTGETASINAENDFERWYNSRLEGYQDESGNNVPGLKYIDGDPTEAYAKFDQEAEQKLKGYTSDKDYSERVKRIIEGRLSNTYGNLYNKRLSLSGQQYDSYDQKTTDAAVEMKKNGAVDSLALIDKNDVSTVQPFENVLEQIRQLRVGRAARIGAAFVDENGKVTANSSVKYELAKDYSEATYFAIDNLISANQVDNAQFMMDRYKDYLDPVKKEKLTSALDKANVEVKAYKALGDLEDKTYPEQKKLIKNLSGDMRVKQKALELLDANERYKQQIQDRDSTEVYGALSDVIQKKMDSEEPFVSMAQLEQDPTYKRLIGRVTKPEQKKALREMIDSPKESDPEALSSLMDQIANGQMYGKPATELLEDMNGLTKEDKTFIRNQWTKQNTESESQLRSRTSAVLSNFDRRWAAAGLDKRNPRTGKISPKILKEKNDLKSKIIRDSDNFVKNMTPAESEIYTNEVIADYVTKKNAEKSGGFFQKMINSFFGKDTPSDENVEQPIPQPARRKGSSGKAAPKAKGAAAAIKKAKKSFTLLSPREQDQAFADFKKANGRDANNAKELQTWLDSQ